MMEEKEEETSCGISDCFKACECREINETEGSVQGAFSR